MSRTCQIEELIQVVKEEDLEWEEHNLFTHHIRTKDRKIFFEIESYEEPKRVRLIRICFIQQDPPGRTSLHFSQVDEKLWKLLSDVLLSLHFTHLDDQEKRRENLIQMNQEKEFEFIMQVLRERKAQ